MTGLLTWLGGAGPGVDDRHERAGYAVGGALVALFAVVSAVVVALAGASARWPFAVVAVAALLAALVFGALSRALATASLSGRMESRARRRLDLLARVAVAALAGAIVAELAGTVLLGGTVDRALDERARRDADSAPAVVTAHTRLDQARADRAALDRTIAQAQGEVEQALVIARCEYNPTPECPQTKITGVPGTGPETSADNAMLDDARTRLTAARDRIQPLDEAVTERQHALDDARDAATRTGDRGLGARWLAAHDYTLGHGGALLLRLALLITGVLLALLPLLLRWWRGETSFDRRVAARTVTERAEQEAAAAVAVKRAEVHAETENLRAEQELASARLAADADALIEREQQRRRVVAAVGNLEIGISEDRKDGPVPASDHDNLPAIPAKTGGGLELPVIGTVPFTDTAARWIRPLVPSFVANALDTATHPLRTVRHAFEETEEITFTLRRTRKVTVESDEPRPSAAARPVTAQVVDVDVPGRELQRPE
ncbi:DUF4407 domain-containing protein [Nocardia sp. NPDC004068]|uniref:DUF4407 domain-containing protein n=1 Tax=Nocardia sp. NPDC004068 TaxID=3364303 RepID=UPI0036C2DFEA